MMTVLRGKGILFLAILLSLALIAAGCSQDTDDASDDSTTTTTEDVGTTAAPESDAPAPFDGDTPVKIAACRHPWPAEPDRRW